jgi:hypothetical protein
MTTQMTDGAAMQTMDDNTDDYAATQMIFVNNVAKCNADADNADKFADNRQWRRCWMTTKTTNKDA